MQAEALTLAGGYNVIAAPPGFPGNLINAVSYTHLTLPTTERV